MWIEIFIGVISGLGLFIFGMHLMSGGLQKTAGNKLKNIIKVLTNNRFMAVIVGLVVTMIVQSSSATSVMLVGFVNSGIMKLSQAVGVIMGANIGTTITGQLISLDLVKVAPIFVSIGIMLQMLKKHTRYKNIAEILIGFGILFIGMGMLKVALVPLKGLPEFKELLFTYGKNPFYGIIAGFTLTFILQSSSAAMGILIALASEGLLPFESALYIIYGENIGTCTTALISSVGSSRSAKQVALTHLTFNIIGTVVFALFMESILTSIVRSLDPQNISRQIANAHTIFNIANVILLFPFANILIKLVQKILPQEEEKEKIVPILDERMLATPTIAIKNVFNETIHMAQLAEKSIRFSIKALVKKDKDYIMSTLDNEAKVNVYQKAIMKFLIELSKEDISDNDRTNILNIYNIINDIERISDHAENISELANDCIDKDIEFDKETMDDMNYIVDKIYRGYNKTITLMKSLSDNEKGIVEIKTIEKEIDILEESARATHIKRMYKNDTTIDSGIIFLDLISNLERISDHFKKIAIFVKKINE